MRPLLRWAGSKKQLLPHLRPYWEASEASRYVEPFAGSAAFFFAAQPQRALLSDSNGTLVEFYRVLRDEAASVYELAASWPLNADCYYKLRQGFHAESDPIRRAATFFYLNRNCFNGIFRTNLKGEFNVPYSGTKTGALPTWEEVQKAVDLLQRADIRQADFQHLLETEVNEGDFVYLDPPYAVDNRRVFVQYNAQTFGFENLQTLAETLHCLDALGVTFVLSYAVSSESLAFFKPWNVRRVLCQRNVAGFSNHRRRAMELIVSNCLLEGSNE